MSRRVGRRALVGVRESLSDRDLAVIASVEEFRLLSTTQLQALHFDEHASARSAARSTRRVLERLVRDRLLARLERRIGGVRAGSAGFVYALGPVGHHLLHGDTSKRWREPSAAFAAHTLAVADVVVDLAHDRRREIADLLTYEAEPACWRDFASPTGTTETLKPDLYVVTADIDSEFSWFVEVDLATETVPTLRRKLSAYSAYWESGLEQDAHDVFPQVLWIAPDDRRAETISRAISGAHRLNRDLFEVTTASQAISVLTGAGP